MKINLIFLHLILNLILFLLIIWQVLFGAIFQIKQIYLKGERNLINNVDIFKTNENIFRFSKNNYLKKILINYPTIKSITVIKKYPSSLQVEINKRNPLFYTIYQDQEIFIDEDGKVLPNLEIWKNDRKIKLSCEISVDKNTNTISDKELVKQFMAISKLIQSTNWHPEEFTCVNDHEYKMLVENIEIAFLPDINADNLISSLQVLFKQFRIEGKQPVRIDLRFSKPVVQYESENLNSASPSGNF